MRLNEWAKVLSGFSSGQKNGRKRLFGLYRSFLAGWMIFLYLCGSLKRDHTMRIKKLSLKNYKRFEKWEREFCDEDGTNEMILLVGNNGTGKSSILQAIGMLLSSAVQPFARPSKFEYPGFKWDNIQRGKMPVEVRAVVEFSQKEITTTREYSQRLRNLFPDHDYPNPGTKKEVELFLSDDEIRSHSLKDFLQVKGYQYALQLTKFERDFDKLFQDVGSLYVYHEQRNAISVNPKYWREEPQENGHNGSDLSEKVLKDILFKWYIYHQNRARFETREGQRRDFFEELEKKYTSMFPGHAFKGFAPKMGFDELLNSEQDFWLSDGRFDYEFSEMSAGERAVFPMMLDFANRNINNSVIIIDEVELHLHPPLQQSLIRALPKWGKNNQFILTTHSDSVTAMFSESQIIRLP